MMKRNGNESIERPEKRDPEITTSPGKPGWAGAPTPAHLSPLARVANETARLRLLFNPADTGTLRRMLLRPACCIGAATLQKLSSEGQTCGLRLCHPHFGWPWRGLSDIRLSGCNHTLKW
jgi:hypothetical protein